MPAFEDQLRIALREQLGDIEQKDLKQLTLPPPAPRSHHGPVIAVAAAVVAITMTAGIVLIARHQPVASPVPTATPVATSPATGSEVTITADTIRVQGAIIPIPERRHAQQITSNASSFEFCLLLATGRGQAPDVVSGSTECLRRSGILVRVAHVSSGGQTEPLPGGFETECAVTPTVPTLQTATLGSRPASKITVTCGHSATPNTVDWALPDQSLTVQTPFDGTGITTAEHLAAQINLRQWTHVRSNSSVPAITTAGSAPPASTR